MRNKNPNLCSSALNTTATQTQQNSTQNSNGKLPICPTLPPGVVNNLIVGLDCQPATVAAGVYDASTSTLNGVSLPQGTGGLQFYNNEPIILQSTVAKPKTIVVVNTPTTAVPVATAVNVPVAVDTPSGVSVVSSNITRPPGVPILTPNTPIQTIPVSNLIHCSYSTPGGEGMFYYGDQGNDPRCLEFYNYSYTFNTLTCAITWDQIIDTSI